MLISRHAAIENNNILISVSIEKDVVKTNIEPATLSGVSLLREALRLDAEAAYLLLYKTEPTSDFITREFTFIITPGQLARRNIDDTAAGSYRLIDHCLSIHIYDP